jgi:hypothetical protein
LPIKGLRLVWRQLAAPGTLAAGACFFLKKNERMKGEYFFLQELLLYSGTYTKVLPASTWHLIKPANPEGHQRTGSRAGLQKGRMLHKFLKINIIHLY